YSSGHKMIQAFLIECGLVWNILQFKHAIYIKYAMLPSRFLIQPKKLYLRLRVKNMLENQCVTLSYKSVFFGH
ncbi:MAG: hypothetical protein K0U40_09775, partial [Betaproteobacteria bacterium]|nr:hypothetical protein [Betaproteobacteria bacterium]